MPDSATDPASPGAAADGAMAQPPPQPPPAGPMPWLAHYPEGVDWHAPIPAAPLDRLLSEAAERFGPRPAFRFFGRRTTWAAADAAASRVAAGLQAMGLRPGDRVGLMLPNCPAYPLLFFGALRAGLIVVNFNPLYTAREVEAQARDAGLSALATLDLAALYPKARAVLEAGATERVIVCPFAPMLPPGKGALFRLLKRAEVAAWPRDGRHVGLPDLLAARAPPRPVAVEPARDVAVLQYTGGTTGTPKGAMLTHANLYANTVQGVRWFKDTRPGEERTLAVLPFFHVFGMTTVLLFAVRAGAEIVMMPRFELPAAVALIERTRPSMMPGVPTLFNAIAGWQGKADLSSIRFCISGGAPLPPEVKARFEARTGCVVVEGYGLTEASPCVCCNPPGGLNKTGSIGLPMPGTRVELRDPADPSRRIAPGGPGGDAGGDAGGGEATGGGGGRGELCVAGPQVMAGYWKREAETRAAFTPDGMLRTADIATMDEQGYVYIVDRIKDLILVSGYNVYPRVVEDAIYHHEAVAECTVVGVPDSYQGESVKAFVVLRPGHELSAEALVSFLRAHLSPVEMPRHIEFRAALPRTPVGKLSKKELVEEERAKRREGDPAA